MDETTDDNGPAEMTDEEKRRDQLLAAPGAVESDADPRIEVTEHDGVKRIDIAPDAAVRPGNPYEEPGDAAGPPTDDDGSLEGPDVETSTSEGSAKGDGTSKPGGLGQDGTIPNDPSGVAAGHTGEQSTFEPEEDEAAPA
ncbi:MAG: hypothetical protein ABWY26_04445 [Microbacterium sp.]